MEYTLANQNVKPGRKFYRYTEPEEFVPYVQGDIPYYRGVEFEPTGMCADSLALDIEQHEMPIVCCL